MTLTLEALINEVGSQSGESLEQLGKASEKAAELTDLGDALLNHFVDRCRRSGHTWAQIGQYLGVTRQAAQKRFVDSVGDGVTLERFTPRARQALDRAQQVADSLNHNYVGTEHQLLALFDVKGGLAARALTDLGLTKEAVERALGAKLGKGPMCVAGPHPLTPRARTVLEEAVRAAVELGHNYVGTEHLLLGLYRGQDGLAKLFLNELGATREAAEKKVIDLLRGFEAG